MLLEKEFVCQFPLAMIFWGISFVDVFVGRWVERGVGCVENPRGARCSKFSTQFTTQWCLNEIMPTFDDFLEKCGTAHIDENICCGCQFCVKVCPYTAISYDESKSISVVNEVICKGCGTCGSACPSGAITSKHFTDKQILSQIEGMMSKSLELMEV